MPSAPLHDCSFCSGTLDVSSQPLVRRNLWASGRFFGDRPHGTVTLEKGDGADRTALHSTLLELGLGFRWFFLYFHVLFIWIAVIGESCFFLVGFILDHSGIAAYLLAILHAAGGGDRSLFWSKFSTRKYAGLRPACSLPVWEIIPQTTPMAPRSF